MRLRPVDLAREHGLSTQAVRNYEAEGILPPAERTEHGYRVYTPRHAMALRVFTALVPAHGHQGAAAILRAVHRGATEDALALIDDGHAQLREDRRTLASVERALRDLEPGRAPGPPAKGPSAPFSGRSPLPPATRAPAPARPEAMFVGDLARLLEVRPATLRTWERAGLVGPRRDPRTGYRVYGPADVRDARLVRQLRRGGYLLEQIMPLLDQVRAAGGVGPLEAALGDWRARLTRRGLAMLAAAAELNAYLAHPHAPEAHASDTSAPDRGETDMGEMDTSETDMGERDTGEPGREPGTDGLPARGGPR
ncbi:TioE family transcriptional regulator [Streptomyces sp. TS71-3]|uniref:TioE family transcriptional regulator n=1 Tax=Streptomyces sp. TS71-3 TaxID=2733862 RepID=UPI001BB3B01A